MNNHAEPFLIALAAAACVLLLAAGCTQPHDDFRAVECHGIHEDNVRLLTPMFGPLVCFREIKR